MTKRVRDNDDDADITAATRKTKLQMCIDESPPNYLLDATVLDVRGIILGMLSFQTVVALSTTCKAFHVEGHRHLEPGGWPTWCDAAWLLETCLPRTFTRTIFTRRAFEYFSGMAHALAEAGTYGLPGAVTWELLLATHGENLERDTTGPHRHFSSERMVAFVCLRPGTCLRFVFSMSNPEALQIFIHRRDGLVYPCKGAVCMFNVAPIVAHAIRVTVYPRTDWNVWTLRERTWHMMHSK